MIARQLILAALALPWVAASEFPDQFLSEYCFDCHDDLTQKGEIRLDDAIDRDWSELESRQFFERVLKVVKAGEMPPPDKKTQPSQAERDRVTTHLHQQLLAHSQHGGSVLRRLNRLEYENTIEDVFGFKYEVPPGFPADYVLHGFDNIGEDLILSPTLMEAYFEAAVEVADALFPPPPKPIESTTVRRRADQMAISYSSSMVIDGSMRLAQRTPNLIRSCTWPTSFEAKASGKYRIAVTLSSLGELDAGPMQFHIYAKNFAKTVQPGAGNTVDEDPRRFRKLAEFEVTSPTPEVFECDVELYRGEAPIFYYANGPLNSLDRKSFESYLRKEFEASPRLLAGWLAVEHTRGLRGGVGWDRVKAKMADDDLDLSKAQVDSPEAKKLIASMAKGARQYVESISYQVFEEGPAIGVHEAVIEGPFERVEDDDDRARAKLRERLIGNANDLAGDAKAEAMLGRFLPLAFRRPVSDEEVAAYVEIASTDNFEKGMHLAIRTALVSPDFLYRETNPGKLQDFDLASRLSYFLTNRPPDSRLRQLSAEGKLSEPDTLEAETRRLLKTNQPFVSNFTAQWLGTRHLAEIMPDPSLLDFNAADRSAMIAETEQFFAEILAKNLPIETFIDPDFTFLNKTLATRIYGRDDVSAKNMTRVPIPASSPFGGILAQASVMMATANGVDTQPVYRGVWVLENVLGDAPPPPPENVPAITPDTRGSKTVRDLLAAHTSEENCAGCHRKIDPPGFVLENFDPIGRWRGEYPENGIAIDSTTVMPDGTELKSVNDLKAYVVRNIDQFGECLAEKLMTYATGRHLTYADRHEISQIVAQCLNDEQGFQDLLLALVQSETFRTR